MGLESGTYISDLNVINPTGTDTINQADDHLRLIKSVLKNTFPNVTGAVTATHKALSNGTVPVGGVIMWSGSTAAIPTGWALCDGTSYSRSDGLGVLATPDLRSKFIQGSGASTSAPATAPAVGLTGGASTVTPTITMTNEAVAISAAQMPVHTHVATVTDAGHGHTVTDSGHTHVYGTPSGTSAIAAGVNYSGYTSGGAASTSASTTGITIGSAVTGVTVANANAGSGATHVHNNTAASSPVATLPPYYTLAFIIKI